MRIGPRMLMSLIFLMKSIAGEELTSCCRKDRYTFGLLAIFFNPSLHGAIKNQSLCSSLSCSFMIFSNNSFAI